MISDVDMVYTKVLVLNVMYNFIVDMFFIWSRLESVIGVSNS